MTRPPTYVARLTIAVPGRDAATTATSDRNRSVVESRLLEGFPPGAGVDVLARFQGAGWQLHTSSRMVENAYLWTVGSKSRDERRHLSNCLHVAHPGW